MVFQVVNDRFLGVSWHASIETRHGFVEFFLCFKEQFKSSGSREPDDSYWVESQSKSIFCQSVRESKNLRVLKDILFFENPLYPPLPYWSFVLISFGWIILRPCWSGSRIFFILTNPLYTIFRLRGYSRSLTETDATVNVS